MILGITESLLFLGMMGLIWMMLDISAGNQYVDNTRQESASPDYHYRIHRSMLPSPVLQKPDMMVSLPAALIERLRNAAYWTGDPPLADLVAEAIEDSVTQMEEINGEAFPQHVSRLKREVMTGRALSGPLC